MGQYDKYICTELHKRHLLPGPTPEQRDRLAAEGWRISMEHVLWIDEDVIPGGYYGESTWIWPKSYPHQISAEELAKRTTSANPLFPHVHDFPELLSWWGTDPDHPEDTTTMGMLIGDEEIILDKSWVAYIPAGLQHMPTRHPGNRVSSRPVCHWTSGPGGLYNREKELSENKPDSKKEELPVIKRSGVLQNAKYIVYDYKPGVKRPVYMRPLDPDYTRPVAYVDETLVPGAEFGCDTFWLLPGEKSRAGRTLMDAHIVPYGTSITLTAMNYADITDLCAEAEFWIGGEKHLIHKSFGAYIPPGLEQGPLIIRNITQQIFFMLSHPVGSGIQKYRGR